MSSMRSYTPEFREAAVALVKSHGLSIRMGCPFARRLIDWGFRFTRWTIGSVVVAPNELCKC